MKVKRPLETAKVIDVQNRKNEGRIFRILNLQEKDK